MKFLSNSCHRFVSEYPVTDILGTVLSDHVFYYEIPVKLPRFVFDITVIPIVGSILSRMKNEISS